MSELTARRNQAYTGATSLPYPVLDQAYVPNVLERLSGEGMEPLPSEESAESRSASIAPSGSHNISITDTIGKHCILDALRLRLRQA